MAEAGDYLFSDPPSPAAMFSAPPPAATFDASPRLTSLHRSIMLVAAHGSRRFGKVLLALILSPILVATVIIALPAIGVVELRRALARRAVRRAFEARWGRHGMRVVIAYSDDVRWRERIEREWLPRIGREAVVLDWKTRQGFRPDASVEAHVFEHWAGRTDFDPVAIVVPRSGRVRTLRFRESFIAHFGGDEGRLTAAEADLFAVVESMREDVGVAAPADALRTGVVARRDA